MAKIAIYISFCSHSLNYEKTRHRSRTIPIRLQSLIMMRISNFGRAKIILVIPSSKLMPAPLYLPGCDPSLTTVNVKVTGANQSPANGTRGPRVTRGGPMACPDGASGNINAHSFEEKEFKGRRNLVTCYLMKNVELIINVSGVVSTILWMCSVSMP